MHLKFSKLTISRSETKDTKIDYFFLKIKAAMRNTRTYTFTVTITGTANQVYTTIDSIVVFDGKLYFGASDETLYELDVDQWEITVIFKAKPNYGISSLLVKDDVLHVGYSPRNDTHNWPSDGGLAKLNKDLKVHTLSTKCENDFSGEQMVNFKDMICILSEYNRSLLLHNNNEISHIAALEDPVCIC